jgi:hypothetical protein
MIHPLLGFAIRGVVRCQGEFNTGHAEQYARRFPKMIEDWRAQWGEGPADAKMDGDAVLVSSPRVNEPVAVRYGWGDNPLIGLDWK